MAYSGPDIEQFIGGILDEPYEDMVILAEKEAMAMERRSFRSAGADPQEQADCRRYAEQLKGFLAYVRSDVARCVVGDQRERYLNLIRGHA